MHQNLDLLEITPIDMFMEVKVNFNKWAKKQF